jgi:hypothetical protein
MKDLARIARKSATLYRELRRDVVRLAAEERPKKRERADGNKSENRATRRLALGYREAVRRLERTALLAAGSENGDYYAELSAAAKETYRLGCKLMKRGRGLPRSTPELDSLLVSCFDHAKRNWPVIGLVCRSRGYAAAVAADGRRQKGS